MSKELTTTQSRTVLCYCDECGSRIDVQDEEANRQTLAIARAGRQSE